MWLNLTYKFLPHYSGKCKTVTLQLYSNLDMEIVTGKFNELTVNAGLTVLTDCAAVTHLASKWSVRRRRSLRNCFVAGRKAEVNIRLRPADTCIYSHGNAQDLYILHLNGSVKEPNISIYFFFPPITQRCSISDVLLTGGRGVSDFSVLKYYYLTLRLLQSVVRFFHPSLSCTMHISADVFGRRKSLVKPVTRQKTCNYIELFGSSTHDCRARRRIYRRT